jgi:DNA-binding FadR family transcriptional regulator
MTFQRYPSELFDFLTTASDSHAELERLPSLNELSKQLGLSVARLREQLEVVKVLGFVDVRPRTGIRRLSYSFSPAVWQSLSYAISLDQANFVAFADLRKQIETVYWVQAVRKLDPKDHDYLQELMARAWQQLKGNPTRIPHVEHRELHLFIYHKLENPFVIGIMEAYWEAYDAVGLSLFTDYEYLETVWNYHQIMVDSICTGDFDVGHKALVEHFDLIYHRSNAEKLATIG